MQGGGDLGVAASGGEQIEDLALTAGQREGVGQHVGGPGGAGDAAAQCCQPVPGAAGSRLGAQLAECHERGLHRGDVAAELGQRRIVGAVTRAPRLRCGLPVPADFRVRTG